MPFTRIIIGISLKKERVDQMKNPAKSLVLLPVVLLSLTACEKAISEEEGKERLNNYSLADAKANYRSVMVKSTAKNENRTGEFKKGGMFYDYFTFENFNDEIDELDSFVLTEVVINRTMMLNDEDQTLPEVEYYTYKTTGLKIVAAKVQEYISAEGLLFNVSIKLIAYALDDGRIEKEEGVAKAKVSGTINGKKISGNISGTQKVTITWNKK